jgi:IS30 family transposase
MVTTPKPYPADVCRDVAAIARTREAPLTQIAKVYCCDPRSPWQRGTNENTNGLLRQYLPKSTDLSGHSQDHLDSIALRLNTRPRKTLGFVSPAANLQAAVASSG